MHIDQDVQHGYIAPLTSSGTILVEEKNYNLPRNISSISRTLNFKIRCEIIKNHLKFALNFYQNLDSVLG